jgi:hypothetical protein
MGGIYDLAIAVQMHYTTSAVVPDLCLGTADARFADLYFTTAVQT